MAWFSCDILSQQILNMQTIGTASSGVASFSTDVTENLINCNCQFAATQASGTPTPSAPIPIVGVDKVNITRTGKNLLGGSKLLANAQAYIPSGTTDTENKTFSFSASASTESGASFTSGVRFKENTAYTIILAVSKSNTNPATNFRVHYTDGTTANITLDGTIEANTKYVKVQTTDSSKTVEEIRKLYASGSTTLYYDECGIFEGTLTAQDFEPYNGTTALINLGGTYYGGEVDAVTGKITLTSKIVTIDGSQTVTVATSNYIKSDATNGFITVDDIYPNVSYAYQDYDFRSNKMKYEKKKNIWQLVGYPNCFVVNNKQIHLNIANDLLGITDYTQETTATAKEKITAFLQNNPIEVVYGIEPIVVYAQNKATLNTLLGNNNIYCDTGNTSVTYLETIKNHYNL